VARGRSVLSQGERERRSGHPLKGEGDWQPARNDNKREEINDSAANATDSRIPLDGVNTEETGKDNNRKAQKTRVDNAHGKSELSHVLRAHARQKSKKKKKTEVHKA